MSKIMRLLFLLLICSLIVAVPSLWATWIDDGVPLCTATGHQNYPQITSDGAGGAIVTWQDARSGNYDIYAQRMDASGTVQWTANEVALSTATGDQKYPQLTSDGGGGAIVTWQDSRGSDNDIYAQRVNISGTVQWAADGVPLCTATASQDNVQVIPDGLGGAIITWQDNRNGNYDIYAQRVNASGTVLWAANGVPICTATWSQQYPQVTSDGGGGAIITWQDSRSIVYNEIYAQRIKASGTVQWTADGVPICMATGFQYFPQVISDGAGGAIVTWWDNRNGNYDIYAQLINASGTVQWTADGISLCTATGDQDSPRITSDGASGAIVTWWDRRSGGYDIYAQRINVSGTVQWTADGVPICTATGVQYYLQATSDGAGGAIMTWRDSRSGDDVYAQRINASGTVQWTADGEPLCTATGSQNSPQITSDGAGGAIVTWQDLRSGSYDIYAQQIDSQGRVGLLSPAIHSVSDVPGDEGGCVNLTWDATPLDYHLGDITEYTVWRALDTPSAICILSSGASIVSSPADAVEATLADKGSPIIRLASLNGEMFYWKLISILTAYRLHGYSEIATTLFDSTAVCDDYHYFQVIAHTSDPSIFYVSDPDSGYSVDNLAPCPPLALVGEQLQNPAGLQLTWQPNTEPDMDCYNVYRGLSEDFEPAPDNLLDSPCDTTSFDDGWVWSDSYYYKVSAVDIHGNESGFALLRPDEITGEEVPAIPGATYLAQNFPNPFNPQTTIEFGLNEASPVSLKIYDAAGRLVATLIDKGLPAGHYSESWNGLVSDGHRAASGVYFYRLETKTLMQNRKMILLR